MAELWRDIEDDIDDELDASQDTVDLDDDTVDASVDLGPMRSMLRPADVLLAVSTLIVGLLTVHWLAPKIGAILLFLLLLAFLCAWAGLIGGVELVGSVFASFMEMSIYTGVTVAELLKRSRLALIVAALVLVWGVAWHVWLNPVVRNRARVAQIVGAVEDRLARNEPLDDDLVGWLDIEGADPASLSAFYRDGALRDIWGVPLVYRTGTDGRFHLYSKGPNQFDDGGERDDVGHVEPLSGMVERAADRVLDRARSIMEQHDDP